MFLEPRSIAVIGASANAGKLGNAILRNLLTQGYGGKVFPINPGESEIMNVKTYASVKDVEGDIDCAVVAIPAKSVPGVLRECAEKRIATVVVISAGFAETGTEEGRRLETEVRAIGGTIPRLIGPNCLGILRPGISMNASFAKSIPRIGNVALVSQSGAMAVAVMDASMELGIGYSGVLSIGNKTCFDECDALDLLEEDAATRVIGLYLEDIADGRRFLETARRVSERKPIVLLKSGVSERGKRAASSHTGALAGADAAVEAACRQTGILRAKNSGQFLNLLEVLSTQPALQSRNIAIVTNAGGPGILATDAAERAGLSLPALGDSTLVGLRKALPEAAATGNPVDILGDAGLDRYVAALRACGDDKGIDGVVVLVTPQVMTPCEDIARAVVSFRESHPLMPVATCYMGGQSVISARGIVQEGGVPSFATPEEAVQALAALQREKNQTPHMSKSLLSDLRATRAAEILKGESGLLAPDTVAELFALYGIPLPKQRLATTLESAVEEAEEIGFPVVCKISSRDILHKTDVGGIRTNLQNAVEVEDAFVEVHANAKERMPRARIDGALIQKHLPPGNEFIIGSVQDPSFGPLVMVGLGGIYAEILEDTAFRITPIDTNEAYRMIRELMSWKILLGTRGHAQSDIDALAEMIATVSAIAAECPQIRELDLNPVFVSRDCVTIADAKVILA